MVGQNKNDICRDVAVPHIYRIVDLYTTIIHLRNFQIKKYPNYFLWDGLLARPYPERAGSPPHKIGEFISCNTIFI
jgi:hypothetical protein